ncbi:hypothetical protein GCM10010377_68840 [Streptomyces viridiviolaceus]|uniref:Uncharacterized protein n=1 Tax=Streptomyces viridiviolaceus TaxID=68282 RepID=A0ABW2EAG6_9ACTN|nr:hypothetical protein [Streptomyces viridiviolaceus]GHB68156.1 hypothetical protein GCM10010377_68840 [Streptomyces viridiviolaceus]
MGLHWAWYALALVGVYRMTAVGFDAAVRRVVRIASLARDEHRSRARVSAPPAAGHPVPPASASTAGLPFDPGLAAPPQHLEKR